MCAAALAAAACGDAPRSLPPGPVLMLDYSVDVAGGPDAELRALDQAAAVVRRRVDALGRRVRWASVSRRASLLHVELIGDLPPDLADTLGRSGSLGFHRALEGDRSVAVAEAVVADPAMAAPVAVAPGLAPVVGVSADSDVWTDNRGVHHWAGYVRARSAAQLAALIPALAPGVVPAGTRLVVEELDATGDPAGARTYLIEDRPVLDGHALRDVTIDRAPDLNRPYLQVEFDDAGAAALAEVTTAEIGHKLVIVVDGRVVSAPVVQERIAGGRVNISLGGMASVQQLEAQASELAEALRGGALAAPLRLERTALIEPTARAR